jgi:hypothetical protein
LSKCRQLRRADCQTGENKSLHVTSLVELRNPDRRICSV